MNSLEYFPKLLIIFFLTALFYSCIQTVTEPDDPIFKEKIDDKMLNARQELQCSGIRLFGKKITENGIVTKVMEIQILNSKVIQEEKEKMDSIGRSIAKIVKYGLTNSNQYMIYQIKFVDQDVSGTITKERWKEVSFPNKKV